MARAAAWTAIAVLVLCGCGDSEEPATPAGRPVTLALDFQPNAAHAGILTARDAGPARRHGLDLTVRSPSSSSDSLKLLVTGRADLAVLDIHDLGLARERGADVVGVGAIVQRPLAAVVAAPVIRRPRELEGRRVGVTGLPSDDAVLTAVVQADGGDPDAVKRTTIGFSAVASLVAGRVDAVVTFWNAEGVALRGRGVRTREFRVDDFGAPRYPELVLATTRKTLGAEPALVRETVAALQEGTREALGDLPAAARRVARASDGEPELVQAQLEAVAPALKPPLRLDRGALERWAQFDERLGILEAAPDVGRAFELDP